MNGRIRSAIVAPCFLLVVALASRVWAQEAQDSQEPAEVAVEAEVAPEPVTKDTTPATPPPSPEVMRPTEHGFKMTPRLIELIAKTEVNESEKELNLQPGQKVEFQEMIGRHVAGWQRRHGRDVAGAVESLMEYAIKNDGQINPQSARELSEKLRPALPAIHDYLDSFLQEARPLLDDSQFKTLSEETSQSREKVKHIEQCLESWSRGEAKRGNLFQQLYAGEEVTKAMEQQEKEAASKPAKSNALQKAEGRYDRAMHEVGPESWQIYLYRAKQVFGFTIEQYKEGEAVLKDYRKLAKEVMTPEWVQKVKMNRIKTHAKKIVDDESIEPWIYHLDHEYEELVKPLREMGREFRREIMALATEEQRAAVLAQLQKFGVEHGMKADEMSAEVLHLAATQPQGQ